MGEFGSAKWTSKWNSLKKYERRNLQVEMREQNEERTGQDDGEGLKLQEWPCGLMLLVELGATHVTQFERIPRA